MAYIDPNLGMPQRYMPGEERPSTFSRLMEAQPSVVGGVFVQAGRGARTIMAGGGFMDDRSSSRFLSGRADKAARRYGAFRKGADALNATDLKSGEQYLKFGKNSKRGARLAAEGGKHNPLVHGARVNTLTVRPRALRRASSISVFSNEGTYTYAQGIRGIGTKRFGALGKIANKVGADATENILGPGLFASITGGRKIDLLERKALGGSSKALSRLGKADTGIQRLASMNNPSMLAHGPLQSPIQMARSMGGIPGGVGALPASQRLAAARASLAPSQAYRAGTAGMVQAGTAAGQVVGEVGARGNLLASAMAGKGTRYMAGYARGALGFGGVAGLEGSAQLGAKQAIANMTEALGKGIIGAQGTALTGEVAAQSILKEGVLKTLGFKGGMEALGTKTGAKVLGMRAFAQALPGINLISTAALVYDVGRLGGELIKSGINLASDAEKSLQGSFSKPVFGMGYRDTEAAATSRSRGVMAIQNSRLNARSALGSEASMMSAHFG